MPEMHFCIRWPDGTEEVCYSPSRVVRLHFDAGESYALDDFLARSRAALTVASDRVRAKYGMPCARALGQLARIEAVGLAFAGTPDARVAVDRFEE